MVIMMPPWLSSILLSRLEHLTSALWFGLLCGALRAGVASTWVVPTHRVMSLCGPSLEAHVGIKLQRCSVRTPVAGRASPKVWTCIGTSGCVHSVCGSQSTSGFRRAAFCFRRAVGALSTPPHCMAPASAPRDPCPIGHAAMASC
jgi:hypothetical protein